MLCFPKPMDSGMKISAETICILGKKAAHEFAVSLGFRPILKWRYDFLAPGDDLAYISDLLKHTATFVYVDRTAPFNKVIGVVQSFPNALSTHVQLNHINIYHCIHGVLRNSKQHLSELTMDYLLKSKNLLRNLGSNFLSFWLYVMCVTHEELRITHWLGYWLLLVQYST